MPTGYTADLYEGKDISFEEFVLQCARAFGALIEMRDSSMDAPIPEEFHPSDYHKTALDKARMRLSEVERWSLEDAEREQDKMHAASVKAHEEANIERANREERYAAMLEKVRNWEPPSSHTRLKEFMIEQLEQSIDFDCRGYEQFAPKPKVSPFEYKQKEKAAAAKNVEYHATKYKKEVDRAHERTNWVRDLRDSLRGVNA